MPLLGAALLTGFPEAWAASERPPDSTGRRSIRVVALGDSTTAKAGGWTDGIKKVYAQRLPAALKPHGIRARVINAGIGDTTTRDARLRLDRDVRRHSPDLVIIQFGINDSWIDADAGRREPRMTREEYRANLAFMIRTLKSDGAAVILMTPNPMRWSDPYYIGVFKEHPGLLDTASPRGINRLLDLYAQDARDVAREEAVPLVDVFKAFEDYDRIAGQSVNDLLLAGDGIHPDDDGHRLVCDLLVTRIVAIFGEGR